MPTLPLPEIIPKSLGENIRAARTARGLTQYELALAVGWKGGQGSGVKHYTTTKGEETRYEYPGSPNSAHVSRIESGRQEPTLGTLRAIAEALGVSLDSLVNGSGRQG